MHPLKFQVCILGLMKNLGGKFLRFLEILGTKVDGFERKFIDRTYEMESNFRIEMEKLRNEHNERTFELEKKFMERTYEMERKFEIEMEKIRIESNERANQLENNFKLEMQKLESSFKIEMEKVRNEHNERTSELEKKFMERTYDLKLRWKN